MWCFSKTFQRLSDCPSGMEFSFVPGCSFPLGVPSWVLSTSTFGVQSTQSGGSVVVMRFNPGCSVITVSFDTRYTLESNLFYLFSGRVGTKTRVLRHRCVKIGASCGESLYLEGLLTLVF